MVALATRRAHMLLLRQLVLGGGDSPLSVLNDGRFTHHFCIVLVVEVLHRLGNLTTSDLGDKIIQTLLNYVAKLHVSHV